MMASDGAIVILDSDNSRDAALCSSPAPASMPSTPTVTLTPQEKTISVGSRDLSITPVQIKRAGADISNLPVSTPKRPKQVRHRRSPAEMEQEKKEKEQRRLERLKQIEEVRLRKEEEQKKKEEAKQKREEARLEALKAKQEERDKREEERKKREEEKQKKEDDRRKKEEDKRKKDEEKRAADEQKQKEKEAKALKEKKVKNQFMNFFKKSPVAPSPQPAARRITLVTTESRFREMSCQPGMTIAPIRRRERLTDTTVLDRVLELGTCDSPLYLAGLAERVQGQCFHLNGPKGKVREGGLCPKFLKFKEDQRPPYWGTFRKRSKVIRPRNPFGQDKVLDYEYDSEAEWEEEEPGESLSSSEGEGEKEEGDDEDADEDDGFFVPHGYLSDDERGGDEMEQELDSTATALLRRVGQGPTIAGPDVLAQYPVVPLVATCPINPLAFAFPSAAPLRRVT